MRKRFKSMLFIIGLLIVICLSLSVGYLFYNNIDYDDTVVIVDGNITVNYLTGNEFNVTSNQEVTFSVTNNSNDKAYYYIQLQDLKGNTENVTYELKNDTNDIDVSDNLKSDIIKESIEIEAKSTTNFTINFKTEDMENDYSGKIVVASIPEVTTNFKDIILSNNEVKEESNTKIGDIALEPELINDENIYYFRGNVLNNYVSFANLLWRIVKINEDGSVKLVLNDVIDVLTKYSEDEVAFSDSLIKESLDSWYSLNLANYADYIANYKFCNDYMLTGETFNAYNRIVTDKNPVNICLGEEVSTKIGLLTADEVMYAGASLEKNESYYLMNSEIKTPYFTMTSAKKTNDYYPFMVNTDGALVYNISGNLLRSARPVINIIANITVTGTGTIEDPYILKTN